MSSPTISVVVSTYEWSAALDVVLWALSEQSDPALEVVVAEDGSSAKTASVVERYRATAGLRLVHVSQPDDGWRKTRILNLGGLEVRGDYVLFLDGDCIPRRGCLDAVKRAASPGWFLASKRLHLGPTLSRRVLEDGLPVWRWSTAHLLLSSFREILGARRKDVRPGVIVPIRDRRRPWRSSQAEFTPPFDAYGFFFCVSRSDFERANGFDMRFVGWGGEDEDIAARLRRLGLRCGWPGPRATMLHLWHPAQKGLMRSNQPLVRETVTSTRVEAVEGLRELRAQVSANCVVASSSSSDPVNR